MPSGSARLPGEALLSSCAEGVAYAVDLGTTTIAASLVDIATGGSLAVGRVLNPQRIFGCDVVTRLAAAVGSDETAREMSRLVNEELAQLAADLLREAGREPYELRRVAIAGNPAMEHLLLGLPVESLARIPYRPMFTGARTIRTSDLGWPLDAEAYLFPLPGGFVGGDLVAFLYGQMSPRDPVADRRDTRLFLDLGTNAEIALSSGDRIYATSAAAGPAFEGGNLSCGMAALAGAIHSVEITGERLKIETIGGATPAGVCGSGALSAIGALLAAGVLEKDGRLRFQTEIPSNLANRIVTHEGSPACLLYRDASREILLTQDDIRQVQLAKGAVRAGIELLLERAGRDWPSVGEVVVTGAFGAVLAPEILKSIGIVPPDMIERVRFVDEGCLSGCAGFLNDRSGGETVSALAEAMHVVPLSGNPRFEKLYITFMNFPP